MSGILNRTCKTCGITLDTRNPTDYCSSHQDESDSGFISGPSQPPRNPNFHKLLEELKVLHEKKSHDYAADSNPFSNFEEAADFAGVTVNQVFMVLLGIKLARIKQLLPDGKETIKVPNNESLLDSFKDFTNYSAIWTTYIMLNQGFSANQAATYLNIQRSNTPEILAPRFCLCGHEMSHHRFQPPTLGLATAPLSPCKYATDFDDSCSCMKFEEKL